MLRTTILTLAATAAFGLAAPATGAAQGPPDHAQANRAQAQGQQGGPDRAQGQGQARGQGQGQAARGQGQDRAGQPGRGGPPAHARARRGGPAPDLETFNRNLVEKAVRARGRKASSARRVEVRRSDDRITVVRADGETLFELERETADELGYWRPAVVRQAGDYRAAARDRDRDRDRGDDRGRDRDRYPAGADDGEGEGPPSFCRSGEGHPVWGRDWCLDKGFGLGDGETAWGLDRDIEDVIFTNPDPERGIVDRGGLIDILGDVVFGRLALQSLVLGAEEPLEGHWLGQRDDGPRVLSIRAGDLPVAELVDDGRDGSVDRILFNLGG